MPNPIAFLAGAVAGYVFRGGGGPPEPVNVPDAVEWLKQNPNARTYDKITLDMSIARDKVELGFVGDFVGFKNIDSTVDLKVRLNEENKPELNLTRVRQKRNHLYYRIYLTNDAGSGTLDLFLALGGEFIPPDDTNVSVESDPGLISGTLDNQPSSGLENRLFWATDVKVLYRDTGTGWQHLSSQVTSGVVGARPAAALLDRYFWATDEHILYHDTGSAWEKAAVADHADLGGLTTDDHHNELHTLTSHTSRAHSELTGVGVDDHHNESHTHGSHTGVGAEDHQDLVTLAGTPNYITILGQVITRGLVDLASHVTGLLPWAGVNKTGSDLADLASRAHGSLTGVGANDHHNRDHATTHQPGGADAMAVNAAAGTGSLRSLGTGSTQAAAGNHTHTLTEDQSVSGSASPTTDANWTGRTQSITSAVTATASLTSVGSSSRVVGFGAFASRSNGENIALTIGGVEAASATTTLTLMSLIGSRTGISGSINVVFSVDRGLAVLTPTSNNVAVSARGIEVAP